MTVTRLTILPNRTLSTHPVAGGLLRLALHKKGCLRRATPTQPSLIRLCLSSFTII
ncbi:MAG: hypothetical protein V7L21_19565 [Nostoc sp.]